MYLQNINFEKYYREYQVIGRNKSKIIKYLETIPKRKILILRREKYKVSIK